ncbi:MAG TPA: hypothetical protein VGS96_11240 [Thermoanaerobaculia bacterium]|jgi:hypothetical protein|nr:hypothetical protein [Thermoanaerobaculia bacterium]
MKDEMPLTGHDFAAIRRSVMTTIEARQARRTMAVRITQIAFAIIVIVLGAARLMRREAVTPAVKSVPTAQVPVHPASSQPRERVAVTESRTPLPIRRNRHRAAPKHHVVVAAASKATPMRLELATADPDIRIIWITNESR